MPTTSNELKKDLDKLNEWLQENGETHTITFSRPISHPEIAEAEKIIGVRFPPSYTNFVTQHGTFVIPGVLTDHGFGNDSVLFSPSQVVEETQRYRKEFTQSEDEESEEIFQDGLVFCADPQNEFFHLFVLSSADETGEMSTRSFDYQDLGNNDPWYEGDDTFDSVIESLIDSVYGHTFSPALREFSQNSSSSKK